MQVTLIVEEVLKDNKDLIGEYCRSLQNCEDGCYPNMAIYGKFLAKLPYNNPDFIKMCLEHFTLRLKTECRKLKLENENEK